MELSFFKWNLKGTDEMLLQAFIKNMPIEIFNTLSWEVMPEVHEIVTGTYNFKWKEIRCKKSDKEKVMKAQEALFNNLKRRINNGL